MQISQRHLLASKVFNEEVTELLAKVESMMQKYGARALQYAESALSYAMGHLSDPTSKM